MSSQQQKLTRYELLAGQHIEPDPNNSGGFIKIVAGQVFESVNDFYANDVRDIQTGRLPPNALTGWPEKFRKLGDSQTTSFTWNPQLETLEQFNERVKHLAASGLAHQQQTASTVPPAPTAQPAQAQAYVDEDSTLQDLEKMSVKELQQQAHHAGIDLKGASKKEDILRIIRASLSSTTV